jgi:hypothetical protein
MLLLRNHPTGRTDELAASGALASLLASGLLDEVLLINALAEDVNGALSASAKRIAGPLLFGKIWERLGISDVLSELLQDRIFSNSPSRRAGFVATLHRFFVSGSDRDCSVCMEDYDIDGAQGLGLHHFYRAMAARRSTKSAPCAALCQGCDRREAVRKTARSLSRSLRQCS